MAFAFDRDTAHVLAKNSSEDGGFHFYQLRPHRVNGDAGSYVRKIADRSEPIPYPESITFRNTENLDADIFTIILSNQ